MAEMIIPSIIHNSSCFPKLSKEINVSDNKKYYYLKLKDTFFNSDDLILLESMQDGYIYSNILLKLYLSSVKNDGKLMYKETIPYNSQMLASITRHQVGTIEKALTVFKEMGLIEILDSGAIYMLEIQNFLGNSTTEADRVREYRRKIKNESKVNSKSLVSYKCTDKCTPEIEIELERERETKKKVSTNVLCRASSDDSLSKHVFDIVTHLNNSTGSRFSLKANKTTSLIKARFKEGHTIMDFITAIDNQVALWKHDLEMRKYLRPQTLFGAKMDGYANQIITEEQVMVAQGKISKDMAQGLESGKLTREGIQNAFR